MYGRRNQRKRGFRRIAVMLLALVMLVGVCVPGLRANADETSPDVELPTGQKTTFKVDGVEELTAGPTVEPADGGLTATYEGGMFIIDAEKATSGDYSVGYTYTVEGEEKTEALIIRVTGPSDPIPGDGQTSIEENQNTSVDPAPIEGQSGETDLPISDGADNNQNQISGNEGQPKIGEDTKTDQDTDSNGDDNVTSDDTEGTQNAIQNLFNRLLSATTYDELDTMMENMTAEDYAVFNQFSSEQNATLQARVAELNAEEVETLADLTVKQGETATFPGMEENDYEFKIYKNGAEVSSQASGITVSNLSNNTIQVQTSASTPVGEYTISYGHTERFLIWDRFVVDGTITLEVIEQTSPDAPVVDNKKMTFDKTVTSRNDGTYDLALTLSGAVGTQTNPAKVDIVFVIDKSGSMAGNRLQSAKNAANRLIDSLDQNSAIDARYNIVAFSGSSSYGDANSTADNLTQRSTTASGWNTSAASAKASVNSIQANGGTNYEAGLLRAQEQLGSARAGAAKIVVFLTDGLPTLRCSNYVKNDGSGYGNGQDDNRDRNINAAVNAVSKIAMNRFYVIGTGDASSDTLNKLANGATLANVKKAMYVNASDLGKVFDDIAAEISTFLCDNVTITDTLSHKDGELMVKVTNPDSVTVKVTKTDGSLVAGPAKTVTLAATTINNFSAELKATYDAKTGVLKLEFPSEYKLEPDYVYTLSAVIEPTEKAYQLYREKGGYTDVADSGTGTHSGDYGFYSNDSATVTYTYNGASGTETYSRPVVQLRPGKLVITKEITGLTGEKLSALQNALSFTVAIDYPDSTKTVTSTVPFTAFTDTDGDGTYVFEITGLSPNTVCTVTETGTDVDSYTVVTKINGSEDNDKSIEVTVPCGETKTLAFTNEYTIANTTVTISKTVSGNMGDWSKPFPFEVTLTGGTMKDGTYSATVDSVGYTVSDGGTKISFSLSNGQKVMLQNVPLSATLTITESEADAYEVKINGDIVKNMNSPGSASKSEIPVVSDLNIEVINRNDAIIDTGIVSDSMPFILLFAVAAVGGGVLLMSKRRYSGKF